MPLATTYSQVKSDYEEKGKIYRPEYPEMVQLKARLETESGPGGTRVSLSFPL